MLPSRMAIILAGGRSMRMGADKLAMRLGSETLLHRAVAATARVCDVVVVAGPKPHGWNGYPDAIFVTEEPAFGGPVAGIAAALAATQERFGEREGEVLVLAGDLENPDLVVEALLAATLGADGLALRDAEGWVQYLAGRYRETQLRNLFITNIDIRDVSVRTQLGGLRLSLVDATARTTRDIDTPEQAQNAGIVRFSDGLGAGDNKKSLG
ncbi:MAG: NTP transferase domain-containing protein [Ruaniaceae bacterium]|nr:NTP transferase domain-containing protein [Ruaniaceae bacterium]